VVVIAKYDMLNHCFSIKLYLSIRQAEKHFNMCRAIDCFLFIFLPRWSNQGA